MCEDGQWHCQNEFREMYIFSPHKRRCEIEGRKNRKEKVTGRYEFLERGCEHGVRGQKDYKMIEINPLPQPTRFRPDFLKDLMQKRAQELQGNLFSY